MRGAKRIVVDYSSPSLSKVLENTDVVISALSRTPEASVNQEALAKACKIAGVKIFVPSDFGTPTEGQDNAVFILKDQFKSKLLKEIGLPYTTFYTGCLTDFVFKPYIFYYFLMYYVQ